jgi:hypothetical protein
MNLLEEGAKDHNLDSSYQEWLQGLPRYVSKKDPIHLVGKYTYLLITGLIAFPFIGTMILCNVVLKTRPPRFVYVVIDYLKVFACAYYHYLFRPIFGNGAGEICESKQLKHD